MLYLNIFTDDSSIIMIQHMKWGPRNCDCLCWILNKQVYNLECALKFETNCFN